MLGEQMPAHLGQLERSHEKSLQHEGESEGDSFRPTQLYSRVPELLEQCPV